MALVNRTHAELIGLRAGYHHQVPQPDHPRPSPNRAHPDRRPRQRSTARSTPSRSPKFAATPKAGRPTTNANERRVKPDAKPCRCVRHRVHHHAPRRRSSLTPTATAHCANQVMDGCGRRKGGTSDCLTASCVAELPASTPCSSLRRSTTPTFKQRTPKTYPQDVPPADAEPDKTYPRRLATQRPIPGEDGRRLDAVGVRTVAGKAQPFSARLCVVGASRRRFVWAVDAR